MHTAAHPIVFTILHILASFVPPGLLLYHQRIFFFSRCRIQFGRWRSWFSTLPGFLFFRWSRLHWFSTAGWGFSWSSAVVFLCFSRPQCSQWLRCSQVHAFSWYVPGNSKNIGPINTQESQLSSKSEITDSSAMSRTQITVAGIATRINTGKAAPIDSITV